MTEINGITPPQEIIPQEIIPQEVNLDSPVSSKDEMSNSPFAKMFKGGATKEELRHFINNCLYPIIQECRRSEMVAKRASKRFLASITGNRCD